VVLLIYTPVFTDLLVRTPSIVEFLSKSLWLLLVKRFFPRTWVCDRFPGELLGIRFVSPLVNGAMGSPPLKFNKFNYSGGL